MRCREKKCIGMKHLFHQVYLTIVISLILVVLAAGAFWQFSPEHPEARQVFQLASELAANALPPANASIVAQQQTLDELGKRYRVDLALFDAARMPIAATGQPLPPPSLKQASGGWLYGHGPAWALRLPDNRWLVVRVGFGRFPRVPFGLIGFLGVIAVIIAIGAYPVVRRLTRRLERLQEGVNSLGAGDLAARVKVEGRDEVAHLAESFNRAAARIEELIRAHKLLLANASHELRTPLSRIRLGIELLKEKASPEHKAGLEGDIAELDHLIDEILLASRLDALTVPDVMEEVDLLALAAEECAHFEDCTLEGDPAVTMGDPWLLRRMIRNLLENAKRHGVPPIEVELRHQRTQIVLSVSDQGGGISETDWERVFMPFQRLSPGEKGNGTGLGLALVRQIARRHKGDAVISPDATHQSRFEVLLPL